MTRQPSLRHAFGSNLAPALILWSAASLLLALYYNSPSFHDSLEHLAQVKANLGLLFVMPAQALAAGVLPFAFQQLQPGKVHRTRLAHMPYLCFFWACQGAITNGFYALQARIFGDNPAVSTIALKTAVDMLLATPLLFMPLVVWAYAFKDAGFSLSRAAQNLGPDWFRRRSLPVYYAALLVWTPTVCVVYALPLALQFPVQAIVQCFWGLILVVMTKHATD